ncbi:MULTISPECIES: hypothetical protein [unclassified Rhizobium]|uniref:hypothetical protein n=1 Tax=unclassified Rhizobium TaxID=2613769 RepID=UPI0010CF4AB6|nr:MULTISPECIES: hypothetical protein [unclassified Rhizobium]MBB3399128.1 hypothetical protein [Rhizobium sp. BK060]MBB4172195.1 hypothetical protein [Rhizobium sp. BK538]TCM60059.1 hypothetical protein EV291_1702 [Rhizobium sp. BK068]
MSKYRLPIRDFCTREEFEANPAPALDAAMKAPVVISASNGRFVLRFEEGLKRSVKDWALSPGQLEDDDRL